MLKHICTKSYMTDLSLVQLKGPVQLKGHVCQWGLIPSEIMTVRQYGNCQLSDTVE